MQDTNFLTTSKIHKLRKKRQKKTTTVKNHRPSQSETKQKITLDCKALGQGEQFN